MLKNSWEDCEQEGLFSKEIEHMIAHQDLKSKTLVIERVRMVDEGLTLVI